MVETDIGSTLAELGLIPVDWVHASQFAKLTGIPEQRLFARKENWPEDLVWTNKMAIYTTLYEGIING